MQTAWGFLAVRLPLPEDKQWAADRVTILQALGVLDSSGEPTGRLAVMKAANVARLDQASWQEQRDKMLKPAINAIRKISPSSNSPKDQASKKSRKASGHTVSSTGSWDLRHGYTGSRGGAQDYHAARTAAGESLASRNVGRAMRCMRRSDTARAVSRRGRR